MSWTIEIKERLKYGSGEGWIAGAGHGGTEQAVYSFLEHQIALRKGK